MGSITYIPAAGKNTSDGAFWKQIDSCAGFEVSKDCPLRYTEMELVTFTPNECLDGTLDGCEDLVAYARFNI